MALAIFCVFSDTFYHGSGEGECLLVIEVAVGAASLQVTFAVKIMVFFSDGDTFKDAELYISRYSIPSY